MTEENSNPDLWTGEEIARLHDPENGVDWDEVVRITGLTRGQARYRKRKYLKNVKSPPASPGEQDDGITVEETRNELVVTVKSTAIKTEEDLVRECSIDEEIWQKDGITFNAWTTPAFDRDAGKWSQIQNYQVKGRYIRRNPEPIMPIVSPVECPVTYAAPMLNESGGLIRSLIICDPQIGYRLDFSNAMLTPFQDRAVLDLAAQIAVAAEVDRIDVLGDYLDMTEWTDRFTREPAFYQTTQPAILEGHWWLRQLREARPSAQITVFEGNHEKRMRDALMNHLPAACDLRPADQLELPPSMSLPRLLAAHALGVRWRGDYPDELEWANQLLGLSHGNLVSSVPGGTARKMAEQNRATIVFGHVHRREMATLTWHGRDGMIHATGFCPGCACHIDGRVPGKKARQNWQQGLAIVDYDPSGTLYNIQAIPVESGLAIWNGILFEARHRLEDLRADLPQFNWGE